MSFPGGTISLSIFSSGVGNITTGDNLCEDLKMTLSENIKIFRKEAGLTQKTLAGKSGLSFSMISKLESGEQTNPSFETLKKIADVLKINPGDLISTPLTIEDLIDDYIEYKRGVNRNNAGSSPKYEAAGHEEPYADLNFRKKLQAINTIPEPTDYEHDDYLDYINRHPEMKKLFHALKNASKDEIIQVTRFIESFRGF